MLCPLCRNKDPQQFYQDKLNHFYQCPNCSGLFRPADNIPNSAAEKARYETHNNDVNDPGYRNFVKPLVDHIKTNFSASDSIGLDFGAGTGPVAAVMLSEAGFQINLYDPYFHPDISVLGTTYDFIICCEVMEHFNDPAEEFKTLKTLLKPNGQLLCKTDLYHQGIKFEKWYYKNDPTHVFIYTKNTLEWIAKEYNLKLSYIDDRSPVFSLPS